MPIAHRYVPTDWANKTDLTLEEVSELNQLNIDLSNTLAQKNPSFGPFQHGNFSCIMIKEVRGGVLADTHTRDPAFCTL